MKRIAIVLAFATLSACVDRVVELSPDALPGDAAQIIGDGRDGGVEDADSGVIPDADDGGGVPDADVVDGGASLD
jgi:hypothetical protein